jgi:hypothetical protein
VRSMIDNISVRNAVSAWVECARRERADQRVLVKCRDVFRGCTLLVPACASDSQSNQALFGLRTAHVSLPIGLGEPPPHLPFFYMFACSQPTRQLRSLWDKGLPLKTNETTNLFIKVWAGWQ